MFTLPPLPWERTALEPFLDAETIDYHYGKHHQAYIDKFNTLVQGTEREGKTLEEIVISVPAGPIYNNAAQALNHALYRESFRAPQDDNAPIGKLLDALVGKWGSFDQFKTEFETLGLNNFGSGWTWLVKTPDGNLEIVNTSNAKNPLTDGQTPLLGIDVWEHSYYIGYRNKRADYLKACWNIINWDVVDQRFL